jgi:hypothetical protein
VHHQLSFTLLSPRKGSSGAAFPTPLGWTLASPSGLPFNGNKNTIRMRAHGHYMNEMVTVKAVWLSVGNARIRSASERHRI